VVGDAGDARPTSQRPESPRKKDPSGAMICFRLPSLRVVTDNMTEKTGRPETQSLPLTQPRVTAAWWIVMRKPLARSR
jgi:hypothetical protein